MREQIANQGKQWYRLLSDILTSEGFLYLLFTVFCVGLLYARAALSISTGFLFGISVLRLLLGKDTLSDLRRYPGFLALMSVTIVYLLSLMHSRNVAQWFNMMEINLLFISLPLGFYAFRRIPGHAWQRLLIIFIGIMTLSAISLLIDYGMHFNTYNAYYQVGKTIPTPVIHVRYSFFLALASVLAFALVLDNFRMRHAKRLPSRLLIFSGLLLAVTVHLLAVRTGIASLYGGLIGLIGLMVIREGRWRLGLAALAGLTGILALAYLTFPSVANKIGYVTYDFEMLTKHGAQAEYSDNVRITSMRHGLTLLRDHLITGTGVGDIEDDIAVLYEKYTPGFPPENRYPPISQYLYYLVEFGIVGTALIFLLLLYPLFRTPFSYLLAGVYLTTFASMIGETTIELQLGKTLFIAMVCIAILYGMFRSGMQTRPAEIK